MRRKRFFGLTVFERTLWLVSVISITAAFSLSGGDVLTLIASLIGVTALLFVAKGYVVGQALTIVFAVVYGVISLACRYYGEMITYLGMSAPAALCTAIAWARHPFRGTREVTVHRLSRGQSVGLAVGTVAATAVFYVILKALGTADLLVSTVSVTTSFAASYLTFFRSPYYAVAYAMNDAVLIVLWGIASLGNAAYWPMVVCFLMFLANDLYGFCQWKRMERRQNDAAY